MPVFYYLGVIGSIIKQGGKKSNQALHLLQPRAYFLRERYKKNETRSFERQHDEGLALELKVFAPKRVSSFFLR